MAKTDQVSNAPHPMDRPYPQDQPPLLDARRQISSAAMARRFARLAWLTVAGQALMAAVAWLLPAVSEYRLISDNISELVLGRFGYLQTLAFLFVGLTTLGLAYTLHKLTGGAPGARIGTLLVGVYGAGAILVAIFPTDRIDMPAQVFAQSPTGIIHVILAMVNFICMIVAMFILSRTFGSIAQFRSLLRPSVLFAASTLALFFAQAEGPLVGLLQRLLVLAISGWMVMVALRIRAVTAWATSEPPTQQ